MLKAEAEAAISTFGLRKAYGQKVALHGLTLTVPRGQVFGLLGPNGAGKTTFVKLLTGLARAGGGHGSLLGRPLGDPRARARLGFLPEQFRFQEWLTAAEVLDLHGQLCGMPAKDRRLRGGEVLELVGLGENANQRIGTFSKGMQQRLGVAQALLNRPDLVILDEPTSALDPLGRRDVRAVIQRLKAAGVTVFLNSHLLSEVELTCDRVAIVNRSRVVREGTVEDLLAARHELQIRAGGISAQLLAAVADRWRIVEHSGQRLVLAVGEPADAPKVVRLLVEHGADVLEVTARRSSLEDVFVELLEKERDEGLDLRPTDAAGSLA